MPRSRRVPGVAGKANTLKLQALPRWTKQGSTADSEAATQESSITSLLSHEVRAGAALFALDQILRADPVWLGCLRMRLALQAAVTSARLLRLSADEAALRDAEQLTRPGDDPGPAGRLYRLWRRFAAQPMRLAGENIAALVDEIGAGERASELMALMQADVVLAAALGWERPLPLAATVIADPAWRGSQERGIQVRGIQERRSFRVGSEGWEARRMAVFGLAAVRSHALALNLMRRAEMVTSAADKLRTRDGGDGLQLILADDCVAPWRMAQSRTGRASRAKEAGLAQRGLGSDRAARRFCESLHRMGALRLLTDRPTFRLYGL
jgi:Protein of unknown function (DUF1403)